MKKKNTNRQGAAIIVYLLVMAIVVTILMVATYSRLLLALKRGQSSTDALIINYTAESEINDWIARLSEGYIKANPFSVHETRTIGTTKLTIDGVQDGDTQRITIEADRPYASTKIVGERKLENLASNAPVDILMGLDCTGSMDAIDPGDTKTRMANLKDAALNFVNNIPKNGKFHLGVYVFGVDAQWVKTSSGQDANLSRTISFDEIAAAIQSGFGDTAETSPACKDILSATSVGTAYVFAQDYFKTTRTNGHRQFEIVITDGDPNSRIPYAACSPSVYCPNNQDLCNDPRNPYGPCYPNPGQCTELGVKFLQCAVSDTNTTLPQGNEKGVRDPNITAYAVTISTSATGPAGEIFTSVLGDNYLPASRAGELKTLLSNILTDILTKRETITIRKVTPGS